MTTLQKLINQSNDAPPNISDTNYLDTDATVGLVEAKNSEIDKSIKDAEDFFQQRIDIFNASHTSRMNNLNKLINFLPKAKQIIDNKINFDNDINHIQMIKQAREDYEADMLDSQAEAINNEYSVELQGSAGDLVANNGPKFAKNHALIASIDTEQLNTKQLLDRYSLLMPSLMAQAKNSLILPNGLGYGDIVLPDDINDWSLTAQGLVLGEIYRNNPDITDREVRKYLLPSMRTAEKNLLSQWSLKQDQIATDAYNKNRMIKVWESTGGAAPIEANFGDTGFIRQRAAYFEEIYPGQGLRFAREEWVDTIALGIKEEFVSQQSVERLLTIPITWNDGSKMPYEEKFPLEALNLRGAVTESHLAMKREADEQENKARELWKFQNIEMHEGVKDLDWVRDTARSWRETFKTTEYPEELKTAYTVGYEDEVERLRRLSHIADTGGIVTEDDIATIQNPTLKAQAAKLVNRAVNGVPETILDESEKLIKSNIAQYTFENDLSKAQTPKFRAIERNAMRDYKIEFARLKGLNQSDLEAQRGAEEYVIDKMRGKDKPYDTLPEYKYNSTAASDFAIANTALIVDKELLFSTAPLAGEEPYLDAAEKYWKSDFKRGSLPEYYRGLSNLFPELDPHEFARTRLESTGRIKQGLGTYVNVQDSRDFTDKSTSSKVYRNLLTTTNMDWMLENITNPAYKKNGGFDAITKNGKFVQLDKPLSQHTIGEVLELAADDYDSFGMYNISKEGLLQVLVDAAMPFDLQDTFDEQTQKAFVLGRLRQKVNKGHGLNGNPYFKRLVNIDPQDEKQFYDIVGVLPPMNQLGNLLPGVAKALVDASM